MGALHMYVTKVIENHPLERNPVVSPHGELTPFYLKVSHVRNRVNFYDWPHSF